MNFSCTVWQAFVNDHASLILSEEERMGMADPESDGSKRDELWSWKFFYLKKKIVIDASFRRDIHVSTFIHFRTIFWKN